MKIEEFVAKLTKFKDKISETARKKIGDKLVKEIKTRTKDGYGFDQGRELNNFKPLKESTIKARRRNKSLDSRTTPETSNQIESGQLVDGIHAVTTTDGGIDIQPAANRKDGVDGRKVAKGQEEMGRTIFKLDEEQIEDIKDQVKEEFIKQFRKSLK